MSFSIQMQNMGQQLMFPIPLTTIEQVTPQWLSATLSTPVSLVTSSKIGTGQLSNLYRLFLTYESSTSNLPYTFILKLAPPSAATRKTYLRYGLSEREVRFYADLLVNFPNLTCLPKCYYSAFAPVGGTFTLLISDAGQDAKPGDDLVGASKEQAISAVKGLAKFHGESLRGKEQLRLKEKVWLKRIPMNGAILGLMFGGFYQRFHGKESNTLSEEDWETARRFLYTFDEWQDEEEKLEGRGNRIMGLNHCDFRMDNMIFGANGQVTIVDWQTVNHGPVVSDLAYFFGVSLKTEDRRAWMEELIDVYVAGVNEGGMKQGKGALITNKDVIDGLRGRAWVGLIGSIVGAMIGERSVRGDVMLSEMMRRSCVMARDFKAQDDLPKAQGGWQSWVVTVISLLGRVLELTGRWG